MSTGYTAYLQKGSKRINLGAAPYALGLDFVPPSITETPNIASGTSANQYGGSKLISKKVESSWYTFSVRVLGTTSNPDNGGAIEGNIKRLDSFLRSGTTAEPVYFCWKANNNVSFEPTLGWWGSTFRAEIITGDAKKSMSFYFGSDLRERGVFADLSLLINPPEWPRRLLASATGGIVEDTVGTTDGMARGVIIAAASAGNLITNPIFGHGTYSNDYGVSNAAVLYSAVTDKNFVAFGETSVRLVNSHASTEYAFGQTLTLTVASYVTSFYAKREDGAAVTASDCAVRSESAKQSSNYLSVGDGWYRVWATYTGSASALINGVQLLPKASVCVDGFQVEAGTYPSPLVWGGALGCAWSGTAHDSYSTRTAGALKIASADTLRPDQGTLVFSMKMLVANTAYAANVRLFDDSGTWFGYYDAGNGKWEFTNGTTTVTSAAASWSAGEEKTLHLVWGNATSQIYINGVASGSAATYTPVAWGAAVWIGSQETPSIHIESVLRGVTPHARPMTAAEVLADYTARASAAAADLRIDWLTYLWTKDGDNVFDQYTLSTTHADWGIVGSVPGSLPCKVTANIVKSAGADAIWIGVNGWNTFINPGDGFADWNGTALAGAVSGEVKQKTVDTTEDYLPGTSGDYISISDEGYKRAIENKPVWAYLSIKDLGSTGLQVKFRHRVYGGGGIADTDWLTLVATAGLTQYMFGPVIIPQYPGDDIATMTNTALFAFRCIRPSGSDLVQTDFFRIIHGRMTKLQPATGTATIRFYYDTDRAYGVDTGPGYTEIIYPEFDDLMFDPNVLNHVVVVSGDQGGSTAITVTVTFDKLLIAPRWALA